MTVAQDTAVVDPTEPLSAFRAAQIADSVRDLGIDTVTARITEAMDELRAELGAATLAHVGAYLAEDIAAALSDLNEDLAAAHVNEDPASVAEFKRAIAALRAVARVRAAYGSETSFDSGEPTQSHLVYLTYEDADGNRLDVDLDVDHDAATFMENLAWQGVVASGSVVLVPVPAQPAL